MRNKIERMKAFWSDESGTTAIEYALIAGGISIVIIISVSLAGETVRALFVSAANF